MSTFKEIEVYGTSTFTGGGDTVATRGVVDISPSATALTGSSDYYFTYLDQPPTTGSTSGAAYTLFIKDAPANATTPWSVYVAAGATNLQALTTGGLISANAGITSANGQTVNVGTSGITSTLNVFGPLNGSGITTFTGVGNITAATGVVYVNPASTVASSSNNYFFTSLAAPTLTGSTTGAAYTFYVAGAPTGTVTAPWSIFVASGATNLQALTTGGLISANLGVTILNGQTLNVGTSGTTSTSNFYGPTNTYGIATFTGPGSTTPSSDTVYIAPSTTAMTGSSNYYFTHMAQPTTSGSTSGAAYTLYIANAPANATTPWSIFVAAGATNLQALTTGGLISANAGITSANGQTVNVGTSGITSTFNVFGPSNHSGIATFTGVGNTTQATGTVYVNPASTAASAANNYFFSSLAAPALTGSTTGSAYTLYVAGAPTGTVTTPYAAYIAGGKTYIGGALQIPTGAALNNVLTSDASGNATWAAPSNPAISNYSVSTTATLSTTSTTAVAMTNMTLTPLVAGTYYFVFKAPVVLGTTSISINIQLAKNGTAITATRATFTSSNTTNQFTGFTTGMVACNGTDVITVQWFASSTGTITCSNQKSFIAIRLSA